MSVNFQLGLGNILIRHKKKKLVAEIEPVLKQTIKCRIQNPVDINQSRLCMRYWWISKGFAYPWHEPTCQWFSIYLKNANNDLSMLSLFKKIQTNCRILDVKIRHIKVIKCVSLFTIKPTAFHLRWTESESFPIKTTWTRHHFIKSNWQVFSTYLGTPNFRLLLSQGIIYQNTIYFKCLSQAFCLDILKKTQVGKNSRK